MQFKVELVNIDELNSVGDAVCTISHYLESIDGFELPLTQSRQLISNLTELPYTFVNEKTSNVLTAMQKNRIKLFLNSKPLIPVPYYLGYSIVDGVCINVKKNITLLPGTETQKFIEIISSFLPSDRYSNYLDVATGSGVLAVCIALRNNRVSVLASDISKQALKIARDNIIIHDLSDRISLFYGNWLSPFVETQTILNTIDVISANPPYVKRKSIANLPRGFSDFAPKIAIDGGHDGLNGFRCIIDQSYRLLKTKGKLVLQVDKGQANSVEKIILQSENYNKAKTYNGANGENRFVVAYKK